MPLLVLTELEKPLYITVLLDFILLMRVICCLMVNLYWVYLPIELPG